MGYYKGCDHCPEGRRRATPREALIDKEQLCTYCGKANRPSEIEGLEQLVALYEVLEEFFA